MSHESGETQGSYHSTSDKIVDSDEELRDVLEIDGVRITPGYIHFRNAYEGKHFKKKVVIQNCGKYLVFVRMCESSSQCFEIEPFPRGKYLSAGMKVVRFVSYSYQKALGAQKGFVSIWINEREITYKFFVSLTQTVLSVEPQVVDFGKIDAVNRASSKSFFLKNSGYKGSMFAIDLGRNPLDLVVLPMKGMIPAMSCVPISIEIVGSKAGEILGEIWLKTDPPLRVLVTGTFIEPKIVVRKWISGLDFTLTDFEATYCGVALTRPLLIKNFSSSHSMFCVMADVKGTTMTLEEARKIDENYCNFYVKPMEGRLSALKGAIIQISFTPTFRSKKTVKYAACFLRVIRMDCKDVDTQIYDERDESTRAISDIVLLSSSRDLHSRHSSTNSVVSVGVQDESVEGEHEFSFEHSIKVCLHGEKEVAGVTLRPTFLTLSKLTLDKLYQREVLVTNNSTILPIKVAYQKVASIDVKPAEFSLNPGGSLEILVTIRSTQMDSIVKNITFDLLARDIPTENSVFRKVGLAHLRIHLDTSDVVKKPTLNQCVLCYDIPDKLEPEFPHRYTDVELENKLKNDKYYIDYIRSLRNNPSGDRNDWLVPKLLQCPNKTSRKCAPYKYHYNKEFIPLSPSLLLNVKITPKSITLRKVAAYTTITDFFAIENLNAFPVQVSTKSSKTCIVFDRTKHVIKSKEKKQIVFSFSTTTIGKYNININVLVNDSTLYEVTAVAHVVPKTLKIESETVEFLEDDGHFKFFRLTNSLNAYTLFTWDVPEGCYKVHPMLGGIQAERSMLCLVTYDPDPSQPTVSECSLTSESGQQKNVMITRQKREPLVVFDHYDIDFGMIPLNKCVTKTLVLKNLRKFHSVYRLANDNPIPGVVVEPPNGVLLGLDSQPFTIKILLKALIQFSLDLEFKIDEIETINVILTGKVAYPSLVLKPHTLHFRRMSPCSFDTLAFKFKNSSPCEVSIDFPFEEYPEFSVSESEDDFGHLSHVTIMPEACKVLYLHFFPQYISTYALFMPYVINGILGPAHINSNDTHTLHHYLDKYAVLYHDVPGVNLLSHPRMLPSIRVNCAATDQNLVFTDLDLKFVFYREGHYNNVTSKDFAITNASTETVTLCIRTDDLQAPFSLTPKGESVVEFFPLSYKITLEPDEDIVFEAEFLPTEVGTYAIKLPIFLRHYFDQKIFNYVRLTGVYDLPEIIPVCDEYHLEQVPVDVFNEVRMSLRLRNHFEDCQMTFHSNLIGANVVFEGKSGKGDALLGLTFSYKSVKSGCYNSNLSILCSCDAQCTISITGTVENCMLSTHAYMYDLPNKGPLQRRHSDASSWHSTARSRLVTVAPNENTTCFPLFPADDDTSNYALYMRNVQRAVEHWLFSQGYYMTSYHRLPDGYTDFCKASKPRVERRFGGFSKQPLVDLPLVQLVTNLAGSGVKQELVTTGPPQTDDDVSWLQYVYTCKCNVLQYLQRFSAYLPHIKTKYLLNYQQYLLYERTKHPKTTPLDETTFRRRCRQCYLDLMLQIIKIFVFDRVVPPYVLDEDEARVDKAPSLTYDHILRPYMMSSEDLGEDILKTGIYGERESVLIKWLQKCFDDERSTLWAVPPCDKEVVFFDEDLRDGLVLGAATAHYVPYVRQELRDMYSRPQTHEELHHNACALVKTWQLLRLSHVVAPDAVERGNLVEMLLLVTYLYCVLPNYTPKTTATIDAPLTEKSTLPLELDNLGDDAIVYEVLFFDNANELFSLEEAGRAVTVPRRGSKIVRVQYHAKFAANTATTIVFSGETPGQKYAKSMAVTLLGAADVSDVCVEIPVELKLYKPCEIAVDFQSPFHQTAEYCLRFAPRSYYPDNDEKRLYTFDEILNLKRAKEIILHNEECLFDDDGRMTAKLGVCLQKTTARDLWVYFTNPDVGDWAVKLHVVGQVTKECYEKIEVTIPHNHAQMTCRCKRRKSVRGNCPKLIHVRLPKVNNLLWDVRKKMIFYNMEEGSAMNFWSNIIYTPMGTRILKLIYNSEVHPLAQVVPDSMAYRVERGDPRLFVVQDRVVVDDIISDDFYEIPIHPLKNLLKAKTAELRLVAESTDETRFYTLEFQMGEVKERQSVVDTID